MSDHLPAELQPPEIQSVIVGPLRTAYEISQERHDSEVGDDAMTFGQHIWKSGSYFLKKELDGLPGCWAEFVNQSLDIQIGRVRLRHHKLGDSEQDDPVRCFPNHPGPASRLGPEQLEIELQWPRGQPREYLGWVIGSYGNPEEGLGMVCLQAVGSERALDGGIARWEEVVVIYQAGSSAAATSAASAPKAATVIAPEPEVGLYQKEETAQEESGRR
ncbi:MAG: hypothetical protein DLM67_20920 [Candidatus Nephthysia bennettiae]|nr:MAG: hypothetical protein DLM67_20920 [Candidatus Dormibacteraeota bacterium]